MDRETPCSYDDCIGELRELFGRVVGVDVREVNGELVLRGEGEFADLSTADGPSTITFQIGGVPPREREGIRFVASSYAVVTIPVFASAIVYHRSIGAPFMLRMRATNGLQVDVWPAIRPLSSTPICTTITAS
jgi:hypothetical protein